MPGDGLAILHDHILKRVRDVFAVISRLFQQLVDLFQLHDADGVFLVREQVADRLADDIVSDILDAIDLDAVINDLAV